MDLLKKIVPEIGNFNDKEVIWLRFEKDFNIIRELKKRTKPTYVPKLQSWYLLDNRENREFFNMPKRMVSEATLQKIDEINLSEFFRFQNQLILHGFSINTQKTYAAEFAQLLYLLKNYPVQELSSEKIKSYILYCHVELKLSENQIHSRMNALKFYFEKVLHREKIFFDVPRPKRPELLPKSLNQKEIIAIINATENLKHQLIIRLCYGMGLRVSEIINLKIEDIDSEKMRVMIQKAKGKKDRYVNLPDSVLQDLREYYKTYKPTIYLFEGKKATQYSRRSAQKVFENAMKKAKIRKKVGIHSLRHSYATHLLEFGTDISLIQKLLGHENITTTLNYAKVVDKHVSSVESPLDRM